MPKPSITASISAPRAAPYPRSPQYATMCTCGIDMATQQPSPAMPRRACAWPGDKPNGELGPGPVSSELDVRGDAGGRWRMTKASEVIATKQKMPMPK